MEELAVLTGSDLINWRGVKIDEDGAGHIFAIARLSEESLVRTTVDLFLSLLIRQGATITSQTMLEQVPDSDGSVMALTHQFCQYLSSGRLTVQHSQLPSAVAELGTSLAKVEV